MVANQKDDSSDDEEDDNYGNMSVHMLRVKLESMDLDGTKNVLIERLKKAKNESS